VADLGDGHHVQRVAGPPVPGPRQPAADLAAGRHAGRGGAVAAGELVPGGEPADVAGLGQDPPGGHRPDAEQAGQRGARCGDQGADLGRGGLQPPVQRLDVGQVVAGELQADPRDVIGGADPGQQCLGLSCRQLAAHPARVSSASSRCSRHTAWVRSAHSSSRRSQQPQADQHVIGPSRGDPAAVQGG